MKKTSLLVFIIAAVMVFSLWPQQVNAAENAARTTTADNVTINNWHDANALDDSTKNVGRIWTDKSVSAGDVTLTSREKESGTVTIKKGADSDFLVGLSALSSTAKITGQTTVPLDIVLVLDVSGSMDDPMGSADRTKRIDALKAAVNSFIDSSATVNDKRADENKQNRIAVVKFAGNESDKVGNEQYRDGMHAYNYTQIVSNYEAYTSKNKSDLQNKVNALDPAGCTATDYAMNRAKKLVDQSKTDANKNADRKNVKRVVIFFTDGEPNHFSGFDDDVANDAISSAKTIKKDADIYTIGIFNGADVSITGHSGSGLWGSWSAKEQFNAFMHGLSSNYPNAETYKKLGTRAKDSKGQDAAYYKVATKADELKNIFTQIEEEIISSAQSPTQVDQGENPSQTGYITLTDQLGDYMQVDDINTLVYANQLYKNPDKTETTKDGKTVVTYTFNQETPDTHHVYPEGNLKDIKITVEKAAGEDQMQTGDLVTVKIPANLIPLRYYEVKSDGSMTIDETYPMRLFYDVSLKAGVEEKLANPDAQLKAYIDANKDENHQVHFYSNKYDQNQAHAESGGVGAYAKFEPAETNDFYYFQNDTVLYTDEACTTPATGSIDTTGATTYYYQRNYYVLGDDGKAVSRTNTVTIPGNSNLMVGHYAKQNNAGENYIPAGTPRTTSLTYFAEDKAEGANKTNTASKSINPVWDDNFKGAHITTYLGNNGRLIIGLPDEPVTLTGDTALKGSKTFIGRDMKANEAFEFTLTAADDDTKTAIQNEKVKIAANGDKAIVAGAKDGVTKAFQFGDVTFTKEGTYTFNINETVPQTPAGGMTYDSHTAQVTIVVTRDAENLGKLNAAVTYNNGAASDVTDRAVFANRYDASTEVTGGTKADISAKKTLRGRNLRAGEFQFKLTTRPADGSNGTVLQEKQNGADGSIAFDSISYKTSDTAAGASAVVLDKAVEAGYAVKSTDADGNTVYTLSYRIYEDTENGTNSNGISVVTGTYDFTVTVTDYGNGVLTAVTNYPNGQNQFEFANQYGTEPVPVEIAGSKTLAHDTSLTPADITGNFTFTLEALTEGAPMPAQTTAVNDAAGNVDFGTITFTTDFLQDAITTDNGVRTKEFEYKVTEAGSAAGVTNDVNASTGKTFKLTLTDDGNGNLSVTRNPADGPLFRFTNTYHVSDLPSSITDQVKVNKTLEGRELKEGEFNFELVEDGNVVATGSNDADSKVVFSSITYTQPGSHVYTVREVKGSETGVTYDDHNYLVYTLITDKGDGTLEVTHQAVSSEENDELVPAEGNAVTFNNIYKAEPTTVTIEAVKKLTGKELKDGEFTFQLKDVNGEVIAEAKNDASGKIKFENLKFEDEGTYEYTVSEVNDKQTGITYDEREFKVTVKVSDNGEGTLSAETGSDDIVFTNSYKVPKDGKTTDTPKKPNKALRRVATGDNSHMVLYLVLMIAAAAAVSMVIIRRKRR
ncbi:hypothetical protein I2700191B6_07450 [Dorea formicigenerans]|uniref:Spy0128 family protein n=1 Tax=Dorea formicigenerans TaxID=39486 RepID=UPI0036F3F4BF